MGTYIVFGGSCVSVHMCIHVACLVYCFLHTKLGFSGIFTSADFLPVYPTCGLDKKERSYQVFNTLVD